VFALTIATLVLGLAAGIYVSARFLPPLAKTREGAIATWTVRVLIGCATAWAAVSIYDMIHAYATDVSREGGFPASLDKSEILKSAVESIFLIGSAGIIYLLAPAEDAREQPQQ
jgi:hypothetical protein